jgi:hypothetical protein
MRVTIGYEPADGTAIVTAEGKACGEVVALPSDQPGADTIARAMMRKPSCLIS